MFITRDTAHAVAHAQRGFVNQLKFAPRTGGHCSRTRPRRTVPQRRLAANAIGRSTEFRKLREVQRLGVLSISGGPQPLCRKRERQSARTVNCRQSIKLDIVGYQRAGVLVPRAAV